jgi:hypothetical protein
MSGSGDQLSHCITHEKQKKPLYQLKADPSGLFSITKTAPPGYIHHISRRQNDMLQNIKTSN